MFFVYLVKSAYIGRMNEHDTTTSLALPNLDNQLCFAVYATEHAFARAYKPLLTKLGLTYPQYLVMMVMWEGKSLSVNAIGHRLGLDSGTLSPLLKRLEAAGHISRKRAASDERRVEVMITAKGKSLEDDARLVANQIVEKTGCTTEEGLSLLSELKVLRNRLLANTES